MTAASQPRWWRRAAAGWAGPAASAGFALVWLTLSRWHPAVTYHFGPPLAAAAWPILKRASARRPIASGKALAAVAGGFLIAMAALGVAIAAGWLHGPTIVGAGSVPVEEVVLTAAAAVWGWRVAARRRRAWFLPAEPSRPESSPPHTPQANG